MNEFDNPLRRRGIGDRMTAGAALFLGSALFIRLVGVVGLAFLGRLLSPSDFGVVALAVFMTGLLEAVLGRHLEVAMIRTQRLESDHLGTAFTMAALLGAAASAALFLSADMAAAAFGAPQLADPLRLLALAPLIDGLRNPRFALFERDLRFHRAAIVEASSRVAMTVTSVILALVWGDYWAMIVGFLALSAVRTGATWALAPVFPGVSLRRWRDFAGFGGWMMGTSVTRFLNTRIDRALVGGGVGVEAAGVYRMGAEIAGMTTQQMAKPMKRVTIPGLAAAAENDERLLAAFRRTRAVTLGIVLPIGVGTALVAPEAVHVVVGPQWSGTVAIVQWLAPAMALSALNSAAQALLTVHGETRALFLRNLLTLALTVPAMLGGIAVAGLMGAVYARTATIALQTALTMSIVRRVTGEGLLDPLRAGARTLIAGAAMVAAVLAAAPERFDPAAGVAAGVWLLAFKAAVGAAAYAATHYLAWRIAGRPDGFEQFALSVARRLIDKARGKMFGRRK